MPHHLSLSLSLSFALSFVGFSSPPHCNSLFSLVVSLLFVGFSSPPHYPGDLFLAKSWLPESGKASCTRLPICAAAKDILLSVAEVVSDTNTARGEQSVGRKSGSLTQDRLPRDAVLTNSFVTGREVLRGLQAHFRMPRRRISRTCSAVNSYPTLRI